MPGLRGRQDSPLNRPRIRSFDAIPGKGLSSWHTSKQTLQCRPPVAILSAHLVVSSLKLASNPTRDLFLHSAKCQFACQGARQDLKSTLRHGARPGTVRTTRLNQRRQVVGVQASGTDSSKLPAGVAPNSSLPSSSSISEPQRPNPADVGYPIAKGPVRTILNAFALAASEGSGAKGALSAGSGHLGKAVAAEVLATVRRSVITASGW